jgi:trans-aconitate 2-methyltransferase
VTADRDEKDWDPGTYARFRGLRLRPALDLLAQVPDLPEGDVVDLGCGSGMVAPDLRRRAGPQGSRRLIGVDTSAATGVYDRLDEADVATWSPEAPPALIFSNALLHWLPDHAELLPRLARHLAPGGVLAVQMPRQFLAPSHMLLRETAAGLFPDRFDWSGWTPPVADPAAYHRLLRPLGEVSAWETEYCQRIDPAAEGHPVRHFTASTAMRPILAGLGDDDAARFVAAYDAALADAYPLEPDGSALMPFRRVFFVLVRPSS